MKTNAGYEILLEAEYDRNDNGLVYSIVLGAKPDKSGFVTWDCKTDANGEKDYFWGHYHTSLKDAREDYINRFRNEATHLI